MDKKLERPAARKGRSDRARREALDSDLRKLYATYGKGEISDHVKELAGELGNAHSEERADASPAVEQGEKRQRKRP